MNEPSYLAPRILDTALQLADHQAWETIRLNDIARQMDISLDDIRAHYAQKEDLVDAWFDRADQAMLQHAARPEFLALTPDERLEAVMMCWMDTLASHHKATREMILGRLEPGHLHIQLAGLLRISRTVQWMREAAHRDASYLNRALEETVLTSIYLTTFARWLTDESEHFEQTRTLLRSLLKKAGFLLHMTGQKKTSPSPLQLEDTVRPGSSKAHH